MVVARMRGSKWVSALPTGNADRSFPGKPGKPENSGSPIYASRIRVSSGGSKWVQALPACNGAFYCGSGRPSGGRRLHFVAEGAERLEGHGLAANPAVQAAGLEQPDRALAAHAEHGAQIVGEGLSAHEEGRADQLE